MPHEPKVGELPAQSVWFDTEFIEDGKTIELLSIGLVRADGKTYYAEPVEADRSRASEWVAENVLPHLHGPIKLRAVIAAEIVEFVGEKPEFWAYYADYDWVALCQLYGTMMALPQGWPMFCRDLKQLVGKTRLIEHTGTVHNALSDAEWTREAHYAFIAAEREARKDEARDAARWRRLRESKRMSYTTNFDLSKPRDTDLLVIELVVDGEPQWLPGGHFDYANELDRAVDALQAEQPEGSNANPS